MTNDQVYNLALKFWSKVIKESPRFKGKNDKQSKKEMEELRNDLASLTVGRAITNKLVTKV